jgi:DNA-binding GntR family transcriptional regulator
MLKTENVPGYGRIQGQLERQIGEAYAHGDRLPAERDLMVKLNVSQPTVRRALQELVQAGRLRRHVGRGTFVQKYGRLRITGLVVPMHSSLLNAQELNDFSVIAFDDLQCNDLVYPGLTTIKTDYARAAERALEILWSDATTAIRETIQPTIDIRESTAPPTTRTRKPLP